MAAHIAIIVFQIKVGSYQQMQQPELKAKRHLRKNSLKLQILWLDIILTHPFERKECK